MQSTKQMIKGQKNKVTEIWLEIEGGLRKYCRRRWNGAGDDVVSEVKVVLFEKIAASKFSCSTPGQTAKYTQEIAHWVAPGVIDYRWGKVSLEDLHEKGFELPAPHDHEESGERDEKLEFLRASPLLEARAKKVIEAVLEGQNIDDACRVAKICRNSFVFSCQQEWEKRDQLLLFSKKGV